ncbi:DUF5683 domain-containing protein [Polaribacter sp.]|nr:DUF5683 domain-containing protein [Polaribacter sp.]
MFFTSFSILSQNKVAKDSTKISDIKISGDLIQKRAYNPLAPSKAAFYSAIFPGMGQAYNKKYWKTPIVWAGLAIPTYYYLTNNADYKRFRTAFRQRSAGLEDEFTVDGVELLSDDTLENAQEQLRENRELSLLSFIVVYVLQIVEASVNAHLLQFETNDNLTFEPTVTPSPIKFDTPVVGLTLKYNF